MTAARTTGATGGVRLLLRLLRSGIGPSILVAVVALLGAFLAVAAPLTILRLGDDELRDQVGAQSDTLRGLQASAGYFPSSASWRESSARIWAPVLDGENRVEAQLPSALRDAVGPPETSVTSAPRDLDAGTGIAAKYVLVADPRFESEVRWVHGGPPALWPGAALADGDTGAGFGEDAPEVPIAVSTTVAATLHLRVGTRLTGDGSVPYVVSGIWSPRDPDAVAWRIQRTLLHVDVTPGDHPIRFAAAELSPRSPAAPLLLQDGGLTVLYPIDASHWRIADAPRIAAALRATASRGLTIEDSAYDDPNLPFVTDTTAIVDDVGGRVAALGTTGTLVAAGPVAVVLLVLGLGIGATLERRRPLIDATSARGGSGRRIRMLAGGEGALVGMPAAAVGATAASLLVPETAPPAAWLVAVVLALAPAGFGIALARPSRGRLRGDLGDRPGRARRRIRFAGELAVIVLAGALTTALVLRGPDQDPAALDPLLVCAPILLAASTGIVVLRLYPLPLRAAQAALHHGRRAAAFLGVARSVREPTIGLSAALAILVAVSVAALSVTLSATVDAATYASARAQVGADIRADLLAARVTTVPEVAGLRDPTPFADQGSTSFGSVDVDLVTAPLDRLARIRSDVPHGLSRLRDGAIPVLVSTDLRVATGTATRLNGRRAVVVGQISDDADLVPRVRWVLADSHYTSRLTRVANGPVTLLAGVASGASVPEVARRLKAALPDGAVVTNARSVYEDLRREPTIGGLAAVLVAASIGAAALAVLAAVLAVVAATRRRDRTVALLRVLGLSRGQGRGMIAAELVPIAVVLVASGIALGLGLASLVVTAVDLSPFTGGTDTPAIVVAPAPLLGIAAAFVLLAGVATTLAVRLGTRLTPADVIRVGD